MSDERPLPPRRCHAKGTADCDEVPTRVCVDGDGLQWFACNDDAHIVDAVDTMPIREWFERFVWND